MNNKLAVVFHGIVGGMGGRNGTGNIINIKNCEKLIRDNILSQYDCDVFIHSWSIDYKDELISLYNPKKYLFQQQETFGFSNNAVYGDEESTVSFRTISRYTSLERAITLKKQYETECNTKYEWVLVLRFDLVFFTKLNLDSLNPSFFYVCSEPHWTNIHHERMVHDIVFLSSSNTMDKYSCVINDIRDGKCDTKRTHVITYNKLCSMGVDIKYVFDRYKDVELYRFVVNPELNKLGQRYGLLDTKKCMEELLIKL